VKSKPSHKPRTVSLTEFVNWSDNGAAKHDITTPATNTTYTATFEIATPPPIIAAAVRVGAPRFIKDTASDTTYLQVPLYVRGNGPAAAAGAGTVSGTWKLTRSDGQTVDVPIRSAAVDLSSGEWRELPGAGARFSVRRDELVGNWTLQATLDGGASTQIMSASVTGFTPEEHGWRFSNTFGKIGGVFAGLGLGMSREAIRRYKSGEPIPDVTLSPTKEIGPLQTVAESAKNVAIRLQKSRFTTSYSVWQRCGGG
jgi:hypothetical protein